MIQQGSVSQICGRMVALALTSLPIFFTTAHAQRITPKVLTSTAINLTSPGYPNNYPNGVNEIWKISAPTGFRIRAKLGSFRLERNNDFLRFRDGHNNELIQLTGLSSPANILSPANEMLMHFTSDGSSTDPGFRFELSIFNTTGVRLVDGNAPFSGRVEITMSSGSEGTVSSTAWTMKDASTVCRELGLPGASSAPTNAHFGTGSGTILLTNVDCTNDNFRLEDCKSLSPCNGCSHYQDAGVICHLPNYMGCYHLPELGSLSVSAKTTAECLSKCELAKKKYAARSGEKCYCRSASEIAFPESPEDDSTCDRMCSGNVNEPCGSTNPSTFTVYDTEFATCENPGVPQNATMTGSSFQFGSKVSYNCSEGSVLVGEWQLTCVLGESVQQPAWNHPIPSCKAIVHNTTEEMDVTMVIQEQSATTNDNTTIVIVVAVVASIAGLILLILLIICCCRWREGRCCRKKDANKMEMWY